MLAHKLNQMGTQNGNSESIVLNGNSTSSDKMDTSEEKNSFEDGELLRKVFDLTLKQKLMTVSDESEKVVEFLQPDQLEKLLDLSVSENGSSEMEKIEELLSKIARYSVRTQHPHFHNQLYGGIDEVGLSGAWLTEALNTNQYTFEVAPVFVLMEKYLINLFGGLYGWSDSDGIFAPGGSISNMYGISLARFKTCPQIKEEGMFGRRQLVIFTSDMSHYSITKASSFMGFGTKQVVKVPTDDSGRMRPSDLKTAVDEVRREGRQPFFVNATAGTTVFGSFDPLEEIAAVCESEKLWMHVDACWGGAVVLSSKHKHLLKGIERADSIAWNPHKMLSVPLQCSIFLVKHKGLLQECNRLGASYLFQPDKYYDCSYDVGDKSIQCGRKPDSLKLWLFFKIHGMHKLQKRIDDAYLAADYLEAEIKRRPGFRPVVPNGRDCTNVCFWFIPKSLRDLREDEEWNKKLHKVAPAIKEKMALKGNLLVGYQPIASRSLVNFFRMVVTSHPPAKFSHMDHVLNQIEEHGSTL